MGMRNVIGIYGINNIPQDIASIFDELGITGFVYFADNDLAGVDGASNLRTFLHGSSWTGDREYRKFAGPGIPDKGDANGLLCHHFPDIAQARAALAALPRFEPRIKRKPVAKPADGLGIYNPRMGEVWTNPALEEVVSLITGAPADAAPATKQETV